MSAELNFDDILVQDKNIFTSQSFSNCHTLGWCFKINCKPSIHHGKYVICEHHTYKGAKGKPERYWYIQGLHKKAFKTPHELIDYYRLTEQPPMPPKEPEVIIKARIIPLTNTKQQP